MLNRQGKFDEAFELHKRSHKLKLKLLPSDHDGLAVSYGNLGTEHNNRGEYRDALPLLQSAQQILEQKQGAKSQYLARVLTSRARAVRHIEGPVEEAEQLYRRALATHEQNDGPTHANVAMVLVDLADLQVDRGKLDEAAALIKRAEEIAETAYDPGHPDRGGVILARARLAFVRGQHDEANRKYQHALDLFRAALGPEHPQTIEPLTGLGLTATARGQHSEARAHLEQAIALLEATLATPEELARVRFALAQALVVTPVDHARAVELARQAVDDYGRYPEANAAELSKIRAWLADNNYPRRR